MTPDNPPEAPHSLSEPSFLPAITDPGRDTNGLRQALAILLSLCLALFVADAILSFLDETLGALVGLHFLTPLRSFIALLALVSGLGVYVLIGLTPAIPKRLFLIVALFSPLGLLALIPCVIFHTPWLGLIG